MSSDLYQMRGCPRCAPLRRRLRRPTWHLLAGDTTERSGFARPASTGVTSASSFFSPRRASRPCSQRFLFNERPFWFNGRPFSLDKKPLPFDKKGLSLNGRPFSLNKKPLSFNGKPFRLDKKPLPFNKKGIPSSKKGLSLSKKGLPLNKKGLSFNGRPFSFPAQPPPPSCTAVPGRALRCLSLNR